MDINAIQIADKPLVLVRDAEIDSVEARLWITFPRGYREYMTQVGEGLLGSLVRIDSPGVVEAKLAHWRRRIASFWFWDKGKKVLPQERALECIRIGDTNRGEELVFHPSRPDHLFWIPRDQEVIYDAGPDLLTAIDWLFSSGKIYQKQVQPHLDFHPIDSQQANL